MKREKILKKIERTALRNPSIEGVKVEKKRGQFVVTLQKKGQTGLLTFRANNVAEAQSKLRFNLV